MIKQWQKEQEIAEALGFNPGNPTTWPSVVYRLFAIWDNMGDDAYRMELYKAHRLLRGASMV